MYCATYCILDHCGESVCVVMFNLFNLFSLTLVMMFKLSNLLMFNVLFVLRVV